MSESMLVRASRDGDQFHYLWAARRTLQLLNPLSNLVAVTIEGAATDELPGAEQVEVGEQLIDIAEYYGSTDLKSATLVRYMQLKHSTLQVDEVWQPSGLKKTIKGFAERYAALQKELPGDSLEGRLEFWFVTNRTISPDFMEAIADASGQAVSRHPGNLQKLEEFTSLKGKHLASFCRMLRLDGSHDNYWAQRNILFQDVSGYLSDMDVDAPLRLKELVNRKALSENATTPSITRIDLLRELRTDESQLFPAPCLIEDLKHAIPRQQEQEIIRSIIEAHDKPVIVHADAGVGKSIFSTRVCENLTDGSVALLYDCFGNGQYRSATGYRHRHKTALVQLANQLSSLGFCHLLIPTVNADSSSYLRAFMHRVGQAVAMIRARNADALLCIIVDAADNAQMAAEEINEPRSFVRDLLREPLPEGVRLVTLCRPYRQAMLDPPPYALSLELDAFTMDETATHLRHAFPIASEQDVAEFHRLSSHNPRVQALALSRRTTLPETLRLLGPNPTTVDGTIATLLKASIANLRDAVGAPEKSQIDLICAGLASLRPLVPIAVLSGMSGVNPTMIRSFALDLGRPLKVNEDTIQFYDEPAETWFREQFKPAAGQLESFIKHLAKLSATSAYVAGALPQLMLEAGQFSELVNLALTSHGLPDTGPVERREIELLRLQFALKASLRIQRYPEAAKLALKAGGESAGNERQRSLLQENADLVSVLMDSNGAQEMVSHRTFSSGWIGSHHIYEAIVLSGHTSLIGEARSRLRIAEDWLKNWAKLPEDKRNKEPVTDQDRAIMALAHLNIDGAAAAARSLRRWTPHSLSYSAGCIVARRLLDHGRYQALDELSVAAGNDLPLVLALAQEARNLHLLLPLEPTERVYDLLTRKQYKADKHDDGYTPCLTALVAMIETAYRHKICSEAEARDLLSSFLPVQAPNHLSSRFGGSPTSYLRACALRAAFAEQPLEIIDVADPALKKEMQDGSRHDKSQELREFEGEIGSLLPWVNLWALSFVRPLDKVQMSEAIAEARSTSAKSSANRYHKHPHAANDIANLWIDILLNSGLADRDNVQELVDWTSTLNRELFTPTLNRLTRLFSGVTGAQDIAFEMAEKAASIHRAERSDVRHLVEGLVEVARSLLAISVRDAESYLDEAVSVANRIGDENFGRWEALIHLAERAADRQRPAAMVAYNFARCAEVTRAYVDRDKHFAWNATIKALVGLCPASSITIASRWRDRGFGRNSRILEVAIHKLLDNQNLKPLDALPMIGFHADWDYNQMLTAALADSAEKQIKDAAVKLTYRYMTLETQTLAGWQKLESILSSAAMTVPELNLRIREAAAEVESKDSQGLETSAITGAPEDTRDWNAVFSGCDLSTPTGIATANENFRSGEAPFYSEIFFRQCFEQIAVGREPDFITAFGDASGFRLWDLRSFLGSLPTQWLARPAIRKALVSMLKTFCRRHSMDIRRDRYHESMPFEIASQTSGISEHELLGTILDAIAESTELAGADRLFGLVGLLAPKLTKDEALGALSYGLELFENVLEESDGDGPWSEQFAPPADMEDAMAGYIWAGLGSPVAATRWEAAHTVVALVALDRARIIDRLYSHAINGISVPFADPRFEFYHLHAQQWLLIAASRAALEYPTALIPHQGYFLDKAQPSQTHVLIRLFAARTLMTLDGHGIIDLPDESRQHLMDTCANVFEDIDQSAPASAGSLSEGGGDAEKDRYFFDGDFDRYWLEPLGRCFSLNQSQVCREVQRTARDDLGHKGRQRWDADARNKAEIYDYKDTSSSRGSYPRVDDLNFYHSYHAMLMTAGRLLSTHSQVKRGEDEYGETFPRWLKRHDIARTDGRWIADRRDPEPRSQPGVPERADTDEWIKSICIEDFDKGLYPGPGWITVWGHRSGTEINHSESISVQSAMVTPHTSAALLRAIQTIEHPHDFRIPSEGDELEFDTPPYQLKGWIQDPQSEYGIDRADPWAGSASFPVPEPARFVVELMSLTTDVDRRKWLYPRSATPVMSSHAWGQLQDDDRSEGATGFRLDASIPFVIEYLKAAGKDLIVKVEIQRNARRHHYHNRGEDELDYLLPSHRIFVFRSDGTVRTL